uniref:Hsp20/alpha crystallin family protein n=1 Tax=candidate division WOR-3 bacterium TaxID=2052148 RepID=A0A7C4TFA2_UNCW3
MKNFRHSDFKIIYENNTQNQEIDLLITDFVNWEPLIDLYVIDDEVIINVELPGVAVNDILIYVGRYFIILSGIKRSPVYTKPQSAITPDIVFHNFEISYGRFERRIDFPMPIEPRQGKYKLENGILTIKFPIEKERIIPIE